MKVLRGLFRWPRLWLNEFDGLGFDRLLSGVLSEIVVRYCMTCMTAGAASNGTNVKHVLLYRNAYRHLSAEVESGLAR